MHQRRRARFAGPIRIAGAALLLLAPASSKANTTSFILGSDPIQTYTAAGNSEENAGPYPGTLIVNNVATSFTLFFCLDGNLGATFGAAYPGTVAIPDTQQLEEAAFLASWALAKGAPSSNQNTVNTVEGPITYAIWQVMGTLGTLHPDPAAQFYYNAAIDAYNHKLLTAGYLNSIEVFTPAGSTQRFIAAVRNDALVNNAAPEASTVILLAVGLALIFGGCVHRKK